MPASLVPVLAAPLAGAPVATAFYAQPPPAHRASKPAPPHRPVAPDRPHSGGMAVALPASPPRPDKMP
ncbi:hypothetical protein, partial [Pseudoalteromonas sp. S3178]